MIDIRKFSLVLSLFISVLALAQHSVSIHDEINYFKTGKECFDNQQYAAAVYNFQHYVDEKGHRYESRKTEAEYYIIYANYYQHKEGIESQMLYFVQKYPGSYLANQMAFALGHFYFDEEDYRHAVKAFEQCNEAFLDQDQLAEYYYPYGYAYFSTKKFKPSKLLFKSAIALNNKYYDEALYYYSFLQYKDKNYNSALEGFEVLHQQGKFNKTVPYYLAQIYFLKEEYQKLIDFAPALLKNKNSDNDVELNRIVGDAYYKMGNYDKAISYLVAYQNGTKKILRQDLYHLGVAYYMQKDYFNAAETFAQITAQNDPISQSAYTYLGECFVKLNDKDRARLAFGTASKYKFDAELREDAYFNYVKLSYETAVSPFNGTIALLEGFLTEFPESAYTLEIYDLMYKSYMTTTNYKDACASIERIQSKDSRLVMASQRVMYYRGVELYNKGRYTDAVNYFKRSLQGDPQEKTLKALALYWMGDAYYQEGQYVSAVEQLTQFVSSTGAYMLAEFGNAHYNMGYSYFKLQRYNDAISWFRKFTQLDKSTNNHWITDANNRVGDCFFLKRDFYNAIKYYSLAIERGGNGTDYAYYQKGFCQGMSQQYNPKIVTLTKLLNDAPESPYADDALYEVARTWVILERYAEAIKAYKQLPNSYPNSKYASKSLLNAGLAYYNSADFVNASSSYKQVVDNYQGTEDARSAMLALKNISIDQNSVNEYIAYAKEKGASNIQEQEEDSLHFLAAEKLYIAQRFDDAVNAFEKYTEEFSNGVYVLVSHFYMADAQMQLSQPDKAMKSLEYIIAQPRSIYTEQSLAVLSATYFNEQQFEKALETYKRLLENAEQKENVLAAKIGIVDCNYALGEAGATILAVDNLLVESLLPAISNKAYYYKAKAYLALENA
ncbi:MAG: tetratricopeptide repeat protein, partial [Bacteroidales bacterium]|nr:tetratricopeptide repeat protein [Bacteroidales bacterium]